MMVFSGTLWPPFFFLNISDLVISMILFKIGSNLGSPKMIWTSDK